MSGTIRFPFRLTPSGQIATAPYGSDQEINDAIAAIVLTDIGERPLSPGFGVTDPVGLAIGDVAIDADIQSALTSYGFEDIMITDTTVLPEPGGRAAVQVEWEREEPNTDPLEEEEDDE